MLGMEQRMGGPRRRKDEVIGRLEEEMKMAGWGDWFGSPKQLRVEDATM